MPDLAILRTVHHTQIHERQPRVPVHVHLEEEVRVRPVEGQIPFDLQPDVRSFVRHHLMNEGDSGDLGDVIGLEQLVELEVEASVLIENEPLRQQTHRHAARRGRERSVHHVVGDLDGASACGVERADAEPRRDGIALIDEIDVPDRP